MAMLDYISIAAAGQRNMYRRVQSTIQRSTRATCTLQYVHTAIETRDSLDLKSLLGS